MRTSIQPCSSDLRRRLPRVQSADSYLSFRSCNLWMPKRILNNFENSWFWTGARKVNAFSQTNYIDVQGANTCRPNTSLLIHHDELKQSHDEYILWPGHHILRRNLCHAHVSRTTRLDMTAFPIDQTCFKYYTERTCTIRHCGDIFM